MEVGLPCLFLKVIVLLSRCWICGQNPRGILYLKLEEAIDFRQFWELSGVRVQTVETWFQRSEYDPVFNRVILLKIHEPALYTEFMKLMLVLWEDS